MMTTRNALIEQYLKIHLVSSKLRYNLENNRKEMKCSRENSLQDATFDSAYYQNSVARLLYLCRSVPNPAL